MNVILSRNIVKNAFSYRKYIECNKGFSWGRHSTYEWKILIEKTTFSHRERETDRGRVRKYRSLNCFCVPLNESAVFIFIDCNRRPLNLWTFQWCKRFNAKIKTYWPDLFVTVSVFVLISLLSQGFVRRVFISICCCSYLWLKHVRTVHNINDW